MSEWNDFYVATAGAAAALTGLIFVGVSISLTKILSIPGLPDRALLSLSLLLNIMVMSILLLVPQQTLKTIGIEVTTLGVITWILVSKLDLNSFRNKQKEYKRQYIFNMLVDQLAILPYIIGGIIILTTGAEGFYWLVPSIIFSFVKAVMDAWVLLVEINR